MLEKTYSPQTVENRLYEFWEQNGLFKPEVNSGAEKAYSLVIPPPNVTGTLHMGHALDSTIQDILTRWHRMLGEETLWMPGMDHAGIATQNVVERKLREDDITKFDLGREKFIETVWDWALARKTDIGNQFKRLGVSPDWSRERFTLDEGLSRAVRHAFVTLYNKNLIYRGTYIVNWCPRCTSAISDIETEYVEEDSFLWKIAYPLADGSDELVVATTRPETMYGDVAVAVNPQDERYQHLIGQKIRLPLANVEIPIIADNYVDVAFGTGALKITPAHDPNDYEVSLRHKLDPVWVLSESGQLKEDARIPLKLQGLTREEARKQTEALLDQQGFLRGKEPHHHSVGKCQRCGTSIEPLLSQQWFVKSKPIAESCLKRLEKGEIKFVPERWTKTYVDWMSNIRDWCISRQLWWGHQIPAWYCDACDQITVALEDPSACQACGCTGLTQETDVLDTWFSSGLWPFSTMGWPDTNAPDFKRFYPTNVLVTGFDIIFFWVARMTMFADTLTNQTPFETVYIHGLIRDEKGQKMSKSKGNTIDPVEIIETYGCDALRYSLTSLITYGGQDIKLSTDKFEQGKLFANKLWNASRFVLMNLEGVDANPIDANSLSSMDQWILAELNQATRSVNEKLGEYRFGEVADTLYEFSWNSFCDWYVEYAKRQLRDEALKANTQRILLYVLDQMLRLLHPVMPFISEEIWQKLPHRQGVSISTSPFPLPVINSHETRQLESIQQVIETIRAVRNLRQTSGVELHKAVPLWIEIEDPAEFATLTHNRDILGHFLKLDSLQISNTPFTSQPENAVSSVVNTSKLVISLAGTVDIAAEKARQEKKRETLQKEYDQLSGRLNDPNFTDKAPEAVVAKNRIRLEELQQQLQTVDSQLAALV